MLFIKSQANFNKIENRLRLFLARILICVAMMLCITTQAQAACRQALALGLDVSGSVDALEYRLQLDGLATALESEAVRDALLGQDGPPVEILVYEWSGWRDQIVVLPWTAVTSASILQSAVETLRAHQRRDLTPTTAIGAALTAGFAHLAERPTCWVQTLDVSGDGTSNIGPQPHDVSRSEGVVVNGLVIGSSAIAGDRDLRQLAAYYRANVISGVGAFVETAASFNDYAEAMERKLIRELTAMVLGQGTSIGQRGSIIQ